MGTRAIIQLFAITFYSLNTISMQSTGLCNGILWGCRETLDLHKIAMQNACLMVEGILICWCWSLYSTLNIGDHLKFLGGVLLWFSTDFVRIFHLHLTANGANAYQFKTWMICLNISPKSKRMWWDNIKKTQKKQIQNRKQFVYFMGRTVTTNGFDWHEILLTIRDTPPTQETCTDCQQFGACLWRKTFLRYFVNNMIMRALMFSC